ncbi:MAG TPA: hypothetical protein VFL03_15920 [Candidatus Limnocylindrales bacterium]|jgi:hypothetical protein|nr:hypothetical protein [Candidatus Limnocylindrales bacterium]
MTRPRRLTALALGAALVLGVAAVGFGASAHSPTSHGALGSKVAFHDAMRKLWEDHIVWTRQFIVGAATEPGNLPDLQPTVDRLLANQADIGNAIKPYYGDAAGAQLTALLRDHILTAADLVTAAKAGDSDATAGASARWYANAHDIAVFLHDANPRQWALADLDQMMKSHLDLTLEEAVARLQGRYADDIAAYDEVHAEILEMADMLSDGIIAQFPAAFAR